MPLQSLPPQAVQWVPASGANMTSHPLATGGGAVPVPGFVLASSPGSVKINRSHSTVGGPTSPSFMSTSAVTSTPSSVQRLAVTPSTSVVRAQPGPRPVSSVKQMTPLTTPTRMFAPASRVAAPTVAISSKVVTGTSYHRITQPQYVPMSQASRCTYGAPVMSMRVVGQQQTQAGVDQQQTQAGVDVQMMQLKDLRSASGLAHIHVSEALPELRAAAEGGTLRREAFLMVYTDILQRNGVPAPPESVQHAVFDLFDRDQNHVVDVLEVVFGLSMLCAGADVEKIDAAFHGMDENDDQYITLDEMTKFLCALFKVTVTPAIMEKMSSMDVSMASVEDLALATAMDCFKAADTSGDNRISLAEFKSWLFTPRSDPGFIFAPLRKAFH